MSSDKVKVEKVLVPNVTISACKLRRSYRGKFGLQYGAHLSAHTTKRLLLTVPRWVRLCPTESNSLHKQPGPS